MFEEKINVAEIMLQIKQEAIQRRNVDGIFFSGLSGTDLSLQETVQEIAQLSRLIQQSEKELHDLRNVGGIIPGYSRFPFPLRQIFHFFSRVMRKGMQFALQDQVDYNSKVDIILDAMEKKEKLMMEILLQLSSSITAKGDPDTETNQTGEAE